MSGEIRPRAAISGNAFMIIYLVPPLLRSQCVVSLSENTFLTPIHTDTSSRLLKTTMNDL
jgi:hypothetical protein